MKKLNKKKKFIKALSIASLATIPVLSVATACGTSSKDNDKPGMKTGTLTEKWLKDELKVSIKKTGEWNEFAFHGDNPNLKNSVQWDKIKKIIVGSTINATISSNSKKLFDDPNDKTSKAQYLFLTLKTPVYTHEHITDILDNHSDRLFKFGLETHNPVLYRNFKETSYKKYDIVNPPTDDVLHKSNAILTIHGGTITLMGLDHNHLLNIKKDGKTMPSGTEEVVDSKHQYKGEGYTTFYNWKDRLWLQFDKAS